ncbi:MAG: metallophosphoesterase [Oligoflexia bacterium]|nr:metallophosphoesterase [Oligoflexia bacterium]
MNRRDFLKLGALTAVTAGVVARGSRITTAEIELKQVRLALRDLPREFYNYRIGLLSDLHHGAWSTNDWVENALSLVQRAGVDLVLFAGDYLWVHDRWVEWFFPTIPNQAFQQFPYYAQPRAIYDALIPLLQTLRAPDGVFGVMGNHDHWYDPAACRELIGNDVITFLTNRSVTIPRGEARLSISGIDDYWTGLPKRPNLPIHPARNECRVFLTHNPDIYSLLLNGGEVEFHAGLAGHTHGGQIVLPGIGAPSYNIDDRRFKDGLFSHPKAQIYTTRGVGTVELPIRVNCPAEVTVLELISA